MDETKVSETILSSDVQEQTAQDTVNDQEGDMEADVMREAASTLGSRQTVEKQAGDNPPPLSKSQQKRLKRKQMWEDQKESRKKIRKEKKANQKAQRRAAREARIEEAVAAGVDREVAREAEKPVKRQKQLVPVSIILDCDFEEYMRESELVSLSSQITRCYSDNRNAEYRTHLLVCSWKGFLQRRFETVLNNSHQRWETCHFVQDDFVQAGKQAQELMRLPSGGLMIDLLRTTDDLQALRLDLHQTSQESPRLRAEETASDPSIVYLTSDSPYTLDRLEPYTSYVIGGIVDKNREKGLCYKRAMERGVRTAKLPIGDYMVMASRQVLTTNQVVEIMLKWLASGDWAVAFDEVIPKRKGGKLKGSEVDETRDDQADEAEVAAAVTELEDEAGDGDGNGCDAAGDGHTGPLQQAEVVEAAELSLTEPTLH